MIGQVHLPKLKRRLIQGLWNSGKLQEETQHNRDTISCGSTELIVKYGHRSWSLFPQRTSPPGSSHCLGSSFLTSSCCKESASTGPLICCPQTVATPLCMHVPWLIGISLLSVKLNGVLTTCIRHSQTLTHKNISYFLFSFLINFVSFSQKISETCFLYAFVFLGVAFDRKVTMSLRFLFIPRGNRGNNI